MMLARMRILFFVSSIEKTEFSHQFGVAMGGRIKSKKKTKKNNKKKKCEDGTDVWCRRCFKL